MPPTPTNEGSPSQPPSPHPNPPVAAGSSAGSGTQSPNESGVKSSGSLKPPSENGTDNSTPESAAGVAKKSKIELVDFLYRDSPRINSLYSQLFNGLLINTETSDAARNAAERGFGLATVVTGAVKKTEENNRAVKETRLPHDVIAADLIAALGALGRISDKIAESPPGTLVRATGRLYLMDDFVIKTAIVAISEKAKDQDETGMKSIRKWLKKVTDEIKAPNAFILQTGGCNVVGILDPVGMHEPVTATYFKYGDRGIDGVGVIGIKESPQRYSGESQAGFYSSTGGIYSGLLGHTVFPAGSINISPLVIYREVL